MKPLPGGKVNEQWLTILRAEDKRERTSERKHSRANHKYALGAPLSLDALVYEGDWLTNPRNCIAEIKTKADWEATLSTLTELQQRCFVCYTAG